MSWRRNGSTCVLLAALAAFPASVVAEGGLSPEEAARRMVLPSGFHAEVFASEPMIRQPVTATFDARGRLWVIEYLQYPVPAGLQPVKIDQYLRTEYDRVPEPPPKGPRGLDRIKILEDTDGDGKADKSTIFVDGLNLASGLALGRGGVYVGQAPYLLFYPDRDGNDVPDGDPEVLLSGFGLQDAHATVNSLAWGPDGRLYGAQGSTVTARIRGIEFQQGIWRYDPDTKEFELFAEGGGNTWGLDWDASGRAFGSSNGGYIAFHVVQGGNYVKGFAKHGPLHNPRTYGYFGPIDYRSAKLGGHVTPGGVIYKGDAYPESYRGAFIGGNLLANAVYRHDLERSGSSYAGRHGEVLIDARDPWFRPIDVLVGPDGCAYVVDWYDKRASHLDPRDNWDKTNGRIYRIVHGERRRLQPFDLSKLPSTDLFALRTSANDWQAAEARRILGERRDPSIIPLAEKSLAAERDPTLALRDLWVLALSGGLDTRRALECLAHPVPAVREWTIRLLGDRGTVDPSVASSLEHLAETEPDAAARSQLAATARRLPASTGMRIVERLLDRAEDRKDVHIPLMLWWACEHHLSRSPEIARDAMLRPEFLRRALVRDVILERAARMWASAGDEGSDLACARLIELATDPLDEAKVVAGVELGVTGRRLESIPSRFRAALERLADRSSDAGTRSRLGIRLGDPAATASALARAADAATPETDRVALIALIGERAQAETAPALVELLRTDASTTVRIAALSALARHEGKEIANALMSAYPKATPQLRARILDVLIARKPWRERMLDAMEKLEISAKDLSLAQVVALRQLAEPATTERVERLWGRIPGPGSPEKIKRVAEVRGILPEGDKGVAARGVEVFRKQCAGCHKLFGEGEAIGPDLTGAERGDLEFLLSSLVDPSAFIRKEYEAQSVVLADGRTLSGLVVDENDKTLTLFDSKREKTVIPTSAIEERKSSPVSLMPEGLLDPLRDDEIRDLIRYIQSSGPKR
ncbi:MAG: c-type cytochrome [Isosphaeraceae bacterium]|nr:c-type cytochrome [Isosphaeraceae bacterium]